MYRPKSLWAVPDSFLFSSISNEVLEHLLIIFVDDTLLGGKRQTSDDLIMSQKDVDSLQDRLPETELCPSALGVSAVLTAPPWQQERKPRLSHCGDVGQVDKEQVEIQNSELTPSSVKARNIMWLPRI